MKLKFTATLEGPNLENIVSRYKDVSCELFGITEVKDEDTGRDYTEVFRQIPYNDRMDDTIWDCEGDMDPFEGEGF